jgi:hypothetical protein
MMEAARDMHYTKEPAPAPVLRYVAAALAFASELIHLWVVPGQLVAAMLPGAFFSLVAACQGFLGASLLFGAGRWTLRLGILLNASVVLVWTLTRLVSVPEIFEPLRLPVDGLGAAATAAEAVLLILLFKLRRSLPSPDRADRGRDRRPQAVLGDLAGAEEKRREGKEATHRGRGMGGGDRRK